MNNIIEFNYLQRMKGDGNMADITKEKMLEIESITKNLLIDNDFNKSPYVDIVSIVKKDGFEVKPQEMPIETTGCLFVSDDKERTERLIMVNTVFKNPDGELDVIFKKSRFITAHEYGHYKLHKPVDQPLYAHRDSDKRDEPEEMEADFFARSILMPMEYFKLYYSVLNEFGNSDESFTVEMLSRLFKVTRNKIRKRIGDISVLG